MQKQLIVPEIFDSPQLLKKGLDYFCNAIVKAKFPVLLTGAGVSTHSGIPDYRSSHKTIIPTGPGKWESPENKAKYLATKKPINIPAINCVPSNAHMAIKALRESYFKQLVTQNVDNLHRKSGISDVIELHGNICIENCSQCESSYYRDYYVRPQESNSHYNGRHCEKCNGQLLNSIVYFSEPLNPKIKEQAFDAFEKADLCLVIGSSLRVNPAQRLPLILVKKELPVLTLNLQPTALEKHAYPVHAEIEPFMKEMLEMMQIPVNKYTMKREINVEMNRFSLDNDFQIQISGYDTDGSQMDFIKEVHIEYERNGELMQTTLVQPNQGRVGMSIYAALTITRIISMRFVMYGNHDEPDFVVTDEGISQLNLLDIFNQMLQQSYESKGNYVVIKFKTAFDHKKQFTFDYERSDY